MDKDWKGDLKSVMVTTGSHAFSKRDREPRDFYATHPDAVRALLRKENFSHLIWEPAAGTLHISKVLEEFGYKVMSTDIVKRCEGVKELDFLKLNEMVRFDGDIITNPPYKYALEFVDMALKYVNFWNKVAMLLRIQFLEGIKRADFFEKHPPRTVYIFKKRARCAMNGDFESYKSPAMSLAWFVWVKGFRGSPSIEWL